MVAANGYVVTNAHVVDAAGGAPTVTVADTGPGIPAGERESVFYRLDASRSSPGSGLGLSLVAAVAKLHEIEVRLEDGRPGLRVVLEWSPRSEGTTGG